MPLMNNNYVSPAWIDNAAPPINDDELNAMSQTLEGSQILVGNGAPTSSTPGKVGQRYADISSTPPTMYVASAGFPGQPIPKLQTQEEVRDAGYLIAYDSNGEFKAGSNDASDVTVLVYDVTRSEDDTVFYVLFTCKSQGAIAYFLSASTTQVYFLDTYYLNTRDNDTGLYYAYAGYAFRSTDAVIVAPTYPNLAAALQAAANPPAVWKLEADPNRNLAQEYSTGSSYAAGDYCIHEGTLWRALQATSGAWDGSKWERARYADALRSHKEDTENPHEVTAAQTGAASPAVLATVQATTAADRNYSAGDYFFYDGQLYEAKEAVEQGEELMVPGHSEPAALGSGVSALFRKNGTVTLGTSWSGSGPYSQTVTVAGAAITGKSKIDLFPTAAQLAQLAQDGVKCLMIENDGGTIKAWAIGAQPTIAMTVDCTVTSLQSVYICEDELTGNVYIPGTYTSNRVFTMGTELYSYRANVSPVGTVKNYIYRFSGKYFKLTLTQNSVNTVTTAAYVSDDGVSYEFLAQYFITDPGTYVRTEHICLVYDNGGIWFLMENGINQYGESATLIKLAKIADVSI